MRVERRRERKLTQSLSSLCTLHSDPLKLNHNKRDTMMWNIRGWVVASALFGRQMTMDAFSPSPLSAASSSSPSRRDHHHRQKQQQQERSLLQTGWSTTAVASSVTKNAEAKSSSSHQKEEEGSSNKIMWEPSEDYKKQTLMYQFQQAMGIGGGYEELWQWSVDHSDEFWVNLMTHLDVIYDGTATPTKEGTTMPDVKYFPNVQLNFAENLLKHGAKDSPLVNEEAIVSISEAREDRRWTFGEMRDDASRVRAALEKLGVTSEDAVGAYLPNLGETILAMLGTTSTGAVWSSVSPDFGAQAVSDRFGQIKPKVLFTANGFVSKGEPTSMVDKVEELVQALPTLERIVVIDMIDNGDATKWSERTEKLIVSWDDFLKEGSSEEDGSAPESKFTKVDFTHPQFVLYSSGTTGMPKSIAHGAGNTLLQHAKELMLHSDLKPKDRMIFFTTCGWMMWK